MKTLFNFFERRNFFVSKSLIALLLFLAASQFSNAQLVTIGTATTVSNSADMHSPYCEAARSHNVQYMYTGTELVANGAPAGGSSINTISFYCNTTTSYPLLNWSIKISQTNSVSNLTAAYSGTFTTVYFITSFTPTANGWNTYTLPTPYYWQGSSFNLIVEVCNDLTMPAASNSGTMRYSVTGFNSTRVIFSDVTAQCDSITSFPSLYRVNTQFNFSPPVTCSGTPSTPTISSVSSVCSSIGFALNATGFSIGTGLSFQWQSSIGCTGSWSNISGATNATGVTVTQTAATCYRLYSLCSGSGLSSVSNAVTVNMNSPMNCYCSGNPTSALYEDIGNVTVFNTGTLNNTSTCSSIGPGPNSVQNIYSNYTTLPSFQLTQTTTATFSISVISCGGSWNNFCQIFIDYNADGDLFDAGELVYQPTTNYSGTHTETGSFTIPINATIGTVRMRVRVIEEFPNATNANPCYTYQYGETEDYNVQISSPTNCTGMPSAGVTATTSLTPVCSWQNFILSTTNAPTYGSTVTYQWEENYNSMGWTNIEVNSGVVAATPNNILTSVTNLPSGSCCQFRLKVVCGFSGQTAVSAPVTVCGNLPTSCYCIPSYSGGNNVGSGDYLNQIVDFGGYNGPVTGPNATAPDYYIYTPASIASIDKGSNYNITLNNCPLNAEYFRVWVDFNQDGIFSANECISDQQFPGGTWLIAAGGTSTATFTCPTNVTFPTMPATFSTRARFRCAHSVVNMDPCNTNYSLGETEDYGVTINTLPDCSGIPIGGTTNSSGSYCTGIPILLSVSGSTSGLGGLVYQWQTATSCSGPWTNLGTSLTQSFIFCAPGTKVFRRKIKCTNSNLPYGDSTYSSCLSLTSTLCYCSPSHTLGTSTGCYIDSVKIEGGGLNHGSGANPTAPYFSDFTCSVPPAVLMQGGFYWATVSTGPLATPKTVAMWGDWNTDGDFVDAGESMGYILTNSPNAKIHEPINVPVTATMGTTRMRVRISDVNAVLDPCLGTAPNYIHGESEDYAVNIIANSCSSSTQPGSITISPTTALVNDFISVTSSGGNGNIIGYEFDWSTPYDFTPANNSVYTYDSTGFVANLNPGVPQGIVYVRAIYKNGGCPATYSAGVLLILDCAPSFALNSSNQDYISNIKLGNSGSIINNSSTFNSNGSAYQNFLSQGPYSVSRGVAIPFQVCVGSVYADGVRVWIDENGDGSFSSTESYYNDLPTVGCHPWGVITIPQASGYVGLAKMRVMCTYAAAPNIDPCYGSIVNAYQYGEVEEYMLDILGCPEITVNPASSICQGQTAVLTGTGPGVVTNWQWTPTNGVNGVVMSPANGSAAYVTVTSTNPTSVFFTVTGTLASGCLGTNTVEVSTIPGPVVITPSSSIICSGGVKILTATGLPTSNYQWQMSIDNITWTNVFGGSNVNPYVTSAANGTTAKYYRVYYSTYCMNGYSNSVKVEIASTPVITFSNGNSSCVTVNWTPVGGGSYSISWSGAASGSAANVTPPYTICGLAGGSLVVTVTLTNPAACAGVSAGTATYAVPCTAPAAPTTSAVTSSSFTLNWLGSGTFKVFYKPVFVSNWSSVLVSGNSYTVTGALSNMLYQCYIQKQNCPVSGTNSSPSPTISFYTLPATSTCATPTITASSSCGNAITIGLSGSPTGNYKVYLQRTYPPPVSTISFNISGSSFVYNASGSVFGSTWNIFGQSVCTGNVYSLFSNPVTTSVAPVCPMPVPDPMYGQITCNGFTVYWNQVMCGASPAASYKLFVSEAGTNVWVNYNTTSLSRTVSNLLSGHTYYFFVRAIGCNNSPGVSSNIQTVSTLPTAICRLEDQNILFGDDSISANSESADAIIYPNPADHFFFVEEDFHQIDLNEECYISLIDILGRTVLIQVSQIENGKLKTIVDLPDSIPAGIYFVTVNTSDSRSVKRLIIAE